MMPRPPVLADHCFLLGHVWKVAGFHQHGILVALCLVRAGAGVTVDAPPACLA
jgi:hypothetical protein